MSTNFRSVADVKSVVKVLGIGHAKTWTNMYNKDKRSSFFFNFQLQRSKENGVWSCSSRPPCVRVEIREVRKERIWINYDRITTWRKCQLLEDNTKKLETSLAIKYKWIPKKLWHQAKWNTIYKELWNEKRILYCTFHNRWEKRNDDDYYYHYHNHHDHHHHHYCCCENDLLCAKF